MSGRFRLAGMVAGAAALCLGFLPTGVSAENVGDLDVVAFSGLGTASPPIQLIGGPDSSFSFQTSSSILGLPGICSATSVDSEGTNDAEGEQGPCTLTSSGTWHNIACGEGTAGGMATLTETPDFIPGQPGFGKASDVYNITYGADFVAGIGVLVGNATEAKDSSESATVVGIVHLTAVGPCPVTNFQISGWAVSTI